jgi:hypothetical protein
MNNGMNFTGDITMTEVSQFLIGFGVVFGITTWFLLRKTMLMFFEYIQKNHNQLWQSLDSPNINSPHHIVLTNTRLRQYILQKQYATSSDFFLTDIARLIRQRLLFCYFCLICLVMGLFLILFAILDKQ